MSMFTLTANRTTALLVLGCVAIFGFVLGIRHGSGGAVPAAAPTQPAWAGTLTLEYPRGWRPVRNGPTLPGLTFTNPLVLVPGGQHHATGLIAGRLANSQSSPLPAALLKTLVAAPRAEVVEATNGQAYRYRLSDYPSRGDSLELYVVPGLDEDATALACYASAGQSAYLGACRQIVSTLRLSGAGTEKLTPDPAYARRLASVFGLEPARVRLRGELASAHSPASITALAEELSRRFNAAAVEAVPATEAPGVLTVAQTGLSRALHAAALAYHGLAVAAVSGAPSSYEKARSEVAGAEGAVDTALIRFQVIGYGA